MYAWVDLKLLFSHWFQAENLPDSLVCQRHSLLYQCSWNSQACHAYMTGGWIGTKLSHERILRCFGGMLVNSDFLTSSRGTSMHLKRGVILEVNTLCQRSLFLMFWGSMHLKKINSWVHNLPSIWHRFWIPLAGWFYANEGAKHDCWMFPALDSWQMICGPWVSWRAQVHRVSQAELEKLVQK